MKTREDILGQLQTALTDYLRQKPDYNSTIPTIEDFRNMTRPVVTKTNESLRHTKELLLQAYWRMTIDLLQKKNIPEDVWPEVLLTIPAERGLEKRNLPQDFDVLPPRVKDLYSHGTPAMLGFLPPPNLPPLVLEAGEQPQDGAKRLVLLWASNAEKALSTHIEHRWRQVREERDYVRRGDRRSLALALGKINDRIAISQRLARVGYTWDKILQYHMLKTEDFTYDDVSNWFSEIGRPKSPEAVRKNFERQQAVIKNVKRLELQGEAAGHDKK